MSEKTYLNVPYDQKELAKQLGAMWDTEKKQWFFLAGSDLAKIAKWLPEKICYQTKYLEPDTDFILPDSIAFEIAKQGLNRKTFARIADFFWAACLKRDMNSEYRGYCIDKECKRIFPEVSPEKVYKLFASWEPPRGRR